MTVFLYSKGEQMRFAKGEFGFIPKASLRGDVPLSKSDKEIK